ncbi:MULTISPECIES: FadR/GntR family transcriptional regulator [Burkholderia]|uniref:FadR/GntR family transcriptional regulator n=1 Tax=Burkholderia TaxID=32008 RepID=UPI00064F48FE|nr:MULTISPECIES: FadR/GntR family transcriptional regulator [Burkholderia]KML19711.1 GntR family transcriptional regulator [Burkholderia cepacia]KMN59552.1 GntR family transcriptional regulator [Burkholderia sp. LK4]
MRSAGALAQTIKRIEMGIQEGRWGAGERLPSERTLAESFGVSRTTVREAVARLASRGILETRRGSGVYLLSPKPARLAAPWLQLIVDTPPLRSETLEFRLVFECAAVRFAAQRASERDLEKFEAILARMRTAVLHADVDEEAAIDGEFHAAITAASHNHLLDQFYASIITMLREHIASNTYDATVNNANGAIQARARLHQHESIYYAIRDRNPDAAQQAMFVHIDYVGNQFNV